MSKMGAEFIRTEGERAESAEEMVRYCEFMVDQLATALELMVQLWDDEHPDDPCACLGATPDCPSPPPCELCQARALITSVRGPKP